MKTKLNDIPFALARVDADGRLRDWNGAFLSQLGLSETEAVARGLDDVLMQDGSSGPIAATVRACAEATGDKTCKVFLRSNMQKKFNLRLIGGRGKIKFCHVQLVPLASAAPSAGSGKSASLIQRVDDPVDSSDFLAYVSHKLRTPVSGLLAVAELLAETDLSREQAQYVELLSASGDELTTLASHIQEMARLESGQVAIETTPTNIGALMRDCIVDHGETAAHKRLNIMLDHSDTMPDKLLLDRQHIRQILDILIGNAIKYTAAGHIRLMTSFADDMLTIRIEDTGVGIDESRLPALFNKGGTVKEIAEKKYSSTGFGLLLVYRLVDLLGGSVDVTSELGRGSSFSVTVPANIAKVVDERTAENQEKTASHAALGVDDLLDDIIADVKKQKTPMDGIDQAAIEPARKRPQLNSLNILVAEDNPVNQKLFQTLLEREGHTLTVVDDGQKAVSLVQMGQSFDIILMDISMPVMDGLDATSAIRSLVGPVGETPILALTAHALDGDRERFLNAGMSGYLSKPVNPDALMHAIADLVPGKKMPDADEQAEVKQETSAGAEGSPQLN